MKNLFFILLSLIAFSGCKKEKVCPDHFTGTNCTDQITPSKITITRISVLGFEPLNSGQYWDSNSGLADVMISLYGNNQLLWESTYTMDCNPNSEYNYYPSPNPVSIFESAFNNPMKVTLTDYDGPVSPVIDDITFSIYSNNNGLPSVIHLTSGYTKVDVYLSYSW